MKNLQLEVDILKETIKVLKKDPDADMARMNNREKMEVVDILKSKYTPVRFLQRLSMDSISEKVICRIMDEEKLCIVGKKQHTYSSYKGEITPVKAYGGD